MASYIHIVADGTLYTEVPFIQRCLLYRGALYTEVSFIQRSPLYRGVLYTEVLCVLDTEVPSIQRCPYMYMCVLQWNFYFGPEESVLISEVLISGVSL